MNAFWDLAAVILGPVAGSFLGLVSLRLPRDQPILVGRSACGGCSRTLSAIDLVPIASFLALRGRCRRCGSPIPRRYLMMELACLAIGGWAALAFDGPQALLSALFGWWLLIVAVIDGEHFWLPDRLTLPLGALGLIQAVALTLIGLQQSWVDNLIGAISGFVALSLIALAYRRFRGREGLGGGDPILLGAIGAWVGWQGLPSVVVWAGLAGLATIVAMQVARRGVTAEMKLPFGVFLAIGGWLVWVFGPLGQ